MGRAWKCRPRTVPTLRRQRVVVLHEVHVDAVLGQARPVPGLAEKAARARRSREKLAPLWEQDADDRPDRAL
jgi:hypothetical protein